MSSSTDILLALLKSLCNCISDSGGRHVKMVEHLLSSYLRLMQHKNHPPGKLSEIVLGGNRFFDMTAKNRRYNLLKKDN